MQTKNKLLYYSNGLVAKWKNKRLHAIKQDDGNIRLVLKRLVTEDDKVELYNLGFFSHVVRNKIIVTQMVLSPESFEALHHSYMYINSGLLGKLTQEKADDTSRNSNQVRAEGAQPK